MIEHENPFFLQLQLTSQLFYGYQKISSANGNNVITVSKKSFLITIIEPHCCGSIGSSFKFVIEFSLQFLSNLDVGLNNLTSNKCHYCQKIDYKNNLLKIILYHLGHYVELLVIKLDGSGAFAR